MENLKLRVYSPKRVHLFTWYPWQRTLVYQNTPRFRQPCKTVVLAQFLARIPSAFYCCVASISHFDLYTLTLRRSKLLHWNTYHLGELFAMSGIAISGSVLEAIQMSHKSFENLHPASILTHFCTFLLTLYSHHSSFIETHPSDRPILWCTQYIWLFTNASVIPWC